MSSSQPPKVISDPRFMAARKMVGHEGAVDMFATLVEETIAKHGDTGLEAAAVFYEYGNALFRSATAAAVVEDDDDDEDDSVDVTAKPDNVKAAAAAAAEARMAAQQQQQQQHPPADDDSKPAAVTIEDCNDEDNVSHNDKENNHVKKGGRSNSSAALPAHVAVTSEEPADSHVHDDDIHLALEMMENAYSILDANLHPENDWIQRQLPRILQGLGDVLRELNRMADAADAYSRALPYREEFVKACSQKDEASLQRLKDCRLLVESNVLVAEALLGCAHGRHVVTTETKDMLVTADERVDYARGYYDKARDELQETVLLMGRMAADAKNEADAEFLEEKQNVCFAATLLMGVGETLATFDEEQQTKLTGGGSSPPAKKLKTGT